MMKKANAFLLLLIFISICSCNTNNDFFVKQISNTFYGINNNDFQNLAKMTDYYSENFVGESLELIYAFNSKSLLVTRKKGSTLLESGSQVIKKISIDYSHEQLKSICDRNEILSIIIEAGVCYVNFSFASPRNYNIDLVYSINKMEDCKCLDIDNDDKWCKELSDNFYIIGNKIR